MAAPPSFLTDDAPVWVGPEREWVEFLMEWICPPHGQGRLLGPCPGQTPSLLVTEKVTIRFVIFRVHCLLCTN